MFVFQHGSIVLEDLSYRPLPHLNRLNPNSSKQWVEGKATGCGKDTGYAANDLQVKSRAYGILPPSGSLPGLDQVKPSGFLTVLIYIRSFMVACVLGLTSELTLAYYIWNDSIWPYLIYQIFINLSNFYVVYHWK